MKTEISKNNYWSIKKINFVLLILFTCLNDLDYFSTILSLLSGGIEINPIAGFILQSHMIFFLYKIIILPMIVWYMIYESNSKKVMWIMIGVNLIYLLAVWGNLRVVF
ncbi:MAG: DUF5658 family protein [Candidatus Gracilibacteria bacterium]|nr:DUF5658 family protein [Candidatus Gracilibacteria bacterium]